MLQHALVDPFRVMERMFSMQRPRAVPGTSRSVVRSFAGVSQSDMVLEKRENPELAVDPSVRVLTASRDLS